MTRTHVARRVAYLLLLICCIAPQTFVIAARRTQTGAWTRQRTANLAWLKSVHFIDARRGWAAGTGGALLRTTNGGADWEPLAPPTKDSILDLRFADELHGWLLCEPDQFSLKTIEQPRSYVLRTVDGGRTWARSEPTVDEPAARLTRLVFSDARAGWTFGELGSLYSTTDGGETWTRTRTASRTLILGGTFAGDRRGWLVGAGGIVRRTDDAGATWREARVGATANTPPLNLSRERLYAVTFADARQGWAAGARGQIWATTNGGATWSRQESNADADLLDIACLDARRAWAVGANGTIVRTRDGGRTWVAEQSRTAHRLERVAALPDGTICAVGFGGTILRRPASDADATRPRLGVSAPVN